MSSIVLSEPKIITVGRIRLVESTPEAVESTPVESTSEFDWVESTGLGLSQNDCCCVNSTVSRLDSVVELTVRQPHCTLAKTAKSNFIAVQRA